MTNAEKAVAFLKKNQGKHWCDGCIAAECGFPRTWTAQMIVKVLIQSADYSVIQGGCVNGHTRRRATSYNPRP